MQEEFTKHAQTGEFAVYGRWRVLQARQRAEIPAYQSTRESSSILALPKLGEVVQVVAPRYEGACGGATFGLEVGKKLREPRSKRLNSQGLAHRTPREFLPTHACISGSANARPWLRYNVLPNSCWRIAGRESRPVCSSLRSRNWDSARSHKTCARACCGVQPL